MNVSELQEKFNGKYKLTKQRLTIFHVLTDYIGHHFSAEEIYDLVRQKYPKMGLATIYRTLELLSDLGIVRKLDFGDGRHRYELFDSSPIRHYHMICMYCGKIIEMTGNFPETMFINNHLENFSVLDYQIYLYGYCDGCKSK